MRSATFRIKIPDFCRTCINCLPFLEKNNVSVKILRCAPLGPHCGHSLLRFEGEPELLDELLLNPWDVAADDMKIEVARTGNGVYSALVVNNNCELSHIINDSGCFLELAIKSDDNDVVFHLIGTDVDSINLFLSSAKGAGFDVRVVSVYEKRTWGGLTYRQEKDLRIAFESGYYNIPSQITLEDLANKMGISKSTLNITLRRAERKIISDHLTNSEANQR